MKAHATRVTQAFGSRTPRALKLALSLGFESVLVLGSAAMLTLAALQAVAVSWMAVVMLAAFFSLRALLYGWRRMRRISESTRMLREHGSGSLTLSIAEEVDPISLNVLSETLLVCSVMVAIFGGVMHFDLRTDPSAEPYVLAAVIPVYICSASLVLGSIAVAKLATLSRFLRGKSVLMGTEDLAASFARESRELAANPR